MNCDPQQWVKSQASLDANVKLAGEEAKDRLYEPKHKKKLVRVLTVVAYVFFVSLAAIMLSLYYVFLWNGNQREVKTPRIVSRCDEGWQFDKNYSKSQFTTKLSQEIHFENPLQRSTKE